MSIMNEYIFIKFNSISRCNISIIYFMNIRVIDNYTKFNIPAKIDKDNTKGFPLSCLRLGMVIGFAATNVLKKDMLKEYKEILMTHYFYS